MSARAVSEAAAHRALADAENHAFWLDDARRPAARAALTGPQTGDLVVVGGGFTGLWTALLAKEREPGRDVVVLEADRIAWGATGRNGGFCSASLTHGEENGRSRFPEEYEQLARFGQENLDEIEATLTRYGIDCGFIRSGELTVATEPYQVQSLREGDGEFLDAEAVQAQIHSPTYLAGCWDRRGTALVDPARLAWGLATACESLGVRIAENTTVLGIHKDGAGLKIDLPEGEMRCRQVALGTNVFRPLLRRLRNHVVPVYDYVLVTEPLSPQQQAAIGWDQQQGVGDSANQFHYYRMTADHRILWGGYDAIYRFGGQVRSSYENRPETFEKLSEHFFTTFPQLDGLRFTHRWAGAIDTSTRFCAFQGTAYNGNLSYSIGYTGLGVGASRWGAQVMLDLLDGEPTARTQLQLTRTKPLPFPPEPLAWIGIQATRASLARADRNDGRRNLWLRALDRVGLGFDS